jgi:exopolyphosphatase/guanosine-5'-triphosphate,3'-diphosphate pyrophosphatase
LKLAAVDIGSNAIRFQISKALEYKGVISFKKVEYVRFPLRLGQDVFKKNEISPEKEAKFIKLMQTFKMLFELYEVDDYIICATSAMRESKNGRDIAKKVQDQLGVTIDIIDGEKEAELINNVLYNELDENSYLHIDVGGGSTELNIFVNRQKMAAHSFKIGSVRRLNGQDSPQEWHNMESWIRDHIKLEYGKICAIGTGGNIGKIYDLANLSRAKDKRPSIPVKKIEEVQKQVASMTLEERINVLMLNEDRADVIVPASEIYLTAMKWAGAEQMFVPELGLKDGLIQMLYKKHAPGEHPIIVNTNKFQK